MVDVPEPHGTLHSEQRGPAYNGSTPVGLAVRVERGDCIPDLTKPPQIMTEADVPWLVDLCKRRYDSKYSELETEAWFRNCVLKSPLLFHAVRTTNAFCISMLSILPWLPNEIECNIVFICADNEHSWEAIKLLRSSIAWAQARKCKLWRICTETNYDLGPLALRVGAKEVTPRYTVTF